VTRVSQRSPLNDSKRGDRVRPPRGDHSVGMPDANGEVI
jgi:hypothetical protein